MMYDLWLNTGERFNRFDGVHYFIFRTWLFIGKLFGWCEKYFKEIEDE